jgi:hypothetical protein
MSERVRDAHAQLIRAFLVDLFKESQSMKKTILENVPSDKKPHWEPFLSK